MEIRERLIALIKAECLENLDLEKKTGIKASTWGNLRTRKQRANEEHITAINKLFPEYAYWLSTGLVIPEAGQISPEIEETRRNSLREGKAT